MGTQSQWSERKTRKIQWSLVVVASCSVVSSSAVPWKTGTQSSVASCSVASSSAVPCSVASSSAVPYSVASSSAVPCSVASLSAVPWKTGTQSPHRLHHQDGSCMPSDQWLTGTQTSQLTDQWLTDTQTSQLLDQCPWRRRGCIRRRRTSDTCSGRRRRTHPGAWQSIC